MAVKKKTAVSTEEIFLDSKMVHHAFEFEQAILGAILLESTALDIALRIIRKPEVFYDDANRKIFIAIQELRAKGTPIDILTVTDYFRRLGELEDVGGAYYITSLNSHVASSANIEVHAQILFQYYMRREMMLMAASIYKDGFNLSIDEFETFDKTMIKLDDLKGQLMGMREVDFSKQVDETMKEIVDELNGKIQPLLSGFKNVDDLTGGRVRGESAIIAARTGIGKTTRMIKEVLNITLKENKKAGIISLETKSKTLIRKMLSNISRVDSALFRNKRLSLNDIDRLEDARAILREYNIQVHDMSGINISDTKAIARKWKSQDLIDVLYIDYLTLIRHQNPFKTNTNDEVEKISQGIKELAMELNIPIVTLAQINRSPENRNEKRPTLSDLRNSGAIEQDADVISLLYRPELYNEMFDQDNNSLEGVMEEHIAKNRNSATGYVYHRFIPAIGEFEMLNFEPNFGKARTQQPPSGELKKWDEEKPVW